jgi:hypothetical protein
MKFRLPMVVCASLLLAIGVDGAMAQSAVKTGKERLGNKANDDQRVDNCKVAPEHWGKKARSSSCAHSGKPDVTH